MKNLSPRLEAVASLVRKGRRVADIGTDHAYLPVYLVQSGVADFCIAADLRKGPLENAKKAVEEAGLEENIILRLSDGLQKFEPDEVDEIVIAGMGGILIAQIIEAAPWLQKGGKHLVLQPMSHPEILRKYLLDNGFCIIDERLVKEDKIYQIILAEYFGANSAYNQIELMLGKINIEKKDSLLAELLEHTKKVYLKRIEGKASANADATEEKELLLEIEKLL